MIVVGRVPVMMMVMMMRMMRMMMMMMMMYPKHPHLTAQSLCLEFSGEDVNGLNDSMPRDMRISNPQQ